MSDEGVTYSFKDLFDKFDEALKTGFNRLDSRLDEINRKIDQKADNTRVAELERKHADYETKIEERFRGVDERFKPLENFILTDSAVALVKGKGLAWLAALVIAIISALIYVSATGGFH